jgi:hypothetical protein
LNKVNYDKLIDEFLLKNKIESPEERDTLLTLVGWVYQRAFEDGMSFINQERKQ